MGDIVAMKRRERERLVEMELVAGGRESLVEAGRRLGLSYRQAKRVWARFRAGGAQGLVHRGRGRVSNRAKSEAEREACLAIYREELAGFGPTLAAEKLLERGYEVDHETLRRWLLRDGQWRVRKRSVKHRRWRERKAHFGELVQLDGSFHRWFGDERYPCLMNMVDDATGTTLAYFSGEETTEAAMRLLWMWLERYGVPRALYTDRKSVYVTSREATREEELAGREPMTAFGLACHRLGIEIIPATSPQAKGRVERSHGVYQDRLVKELGLCRVTTLEGANQLLREGFIDGLNRRFAKPAASACDFHRPVPEGVALEDIFVLEETRQVNNDWTVKWEGRWYQLRRGKATLPPAKSTVTVQRRLDGTRRIVYRGESVDFEEVGAPQRSRPPSSLGPQPRVSASPAADHPWRRPWSAVASLASS